MTYDDILSIEDDEARRRAIEEMMRLDRPRYFRDEAVQQEYRDILDRQGARQQGREQNPLAPGAEVGIPVERSTVGQPRRDREALAGRDQSVDQNIDPTDLLSLDTANSGRIDDPRILSDVTPDNDWTPGAQYAGRKRPPAALRGILDEARREYYRPGGHHEMPRKYYEKWNLQPETFEIFKGSTTGNWGTYRVENANGPRIGNIYDYAHRAYNDAVGGLALDFFSNNGIRPDGSNMTPPQALEFLAQIRLSDDPRIRDFNYNIWRMRRFMRLRSGSDD